MEGRKDVNMSIGQMTSVSYVMFGISGVSAVAAAVLFFALDITKCWRMVSGRRPVPGKRRRKAVTEELKRYPSVETVLLDDAGVGETEPLGTINLEMIQDIVYMQDTVEIGEILPNYNFCEKRIN